MQTNNGSKKKNRDALSRLIAALWVILIVLIVCIGIVILLPQQDAASEDVVRTGYIAAGSDHSVALRADGTVIASGDNNAGQCNVSGWTQIAAVSAGAEHTVGLREDGTVVAVGRSGEGQCDVARWTGITAVSAGGYHTLGLCTDGTVVSVGENSDDRRSVGNWTDIVAIAAGYKHSVGLRADGTVVSTGSNYFGQCAVDDWTDIVAVAAGAWHTIGLRADGTVVAVGMDMEGQCSVDSWTDIVSVSAGFYHTLGLHADGTVVSTEYVQFEDEQYDWGQFNVSRWTDVVSVAAGAMHSIALKTDGTVVAAKFTGASSYYKGQCDVTNWQGIRVPDAVLAESDEAFRIGDTVKLGRYEQDNDPSDGKEEIEWEVLQVKDGKALVISKYVLDCHDYNPYDKNRTDSLTWGTCTLRPWINGDFLNKAFTKEEQKRIVTSTVTADPIPNHPDVVQGNNTQDKVFLLSLAEIDEYFGTEEDRICQPTKYVRAHYNVYDENDDAFQRGVPNAVYWRLRTASGSFSAYSVGPDGKTVCAVGSAAYTYHGIRPAMWITAE